MKEPPALLRYVKRMKQWFVLFSCIAVPAVMVCAVFAFAGYIGFWFVAPAVLVAYLALYAWYALRVSMGTVIGLEVAGGLVHIKTRRATHTFDAERGCVAVRERRGAYVVTFRTQTSQDSFLFYRRVPFAKPYEEGFTPSDLALFFNGELTKEL